MVRPDPGTSYSFFCKTRDAFIHGIKEPGIRELTLEQLFVTTPHLFAPYRGGYRGCTDTPSQGYQGFRWSHPPISGHDPPRSDERGSAPACDDRFQRIWLKYVEQQLTLGAKAHTAGVVLLSAVSYSTTPNPPVFAPERVNQLKLGLEPP